MSTAPSVTPHGLGLVQPTSSNTHATELIESAEVHLEVCSSDALACDPVIARTHRTAGKGIWSPGDTGGR